MSQRIEIFYYRGVATLTIRRVTIEDEGEYTCEVYNEWGVCSSSAELLVESKRAPLSRFEHAVSIVKQINASRSI